MNDEETFLNLCKTEIHRDGIQDLTDWLKKSDFFTAPASTKFHGNFEGGLCKHSLNVAQMLSDLCTLQNLSFNRESVFIVSLFHDLCKVNFYKKGFRNIKDENGCWITKEFWEIDEKFPCGEHADKSIILLQQYMKLSPEEIFAIRAHMGGSATVYETFSRRNICYTRAHGRIRYLRKRRKFSYRQNF